MVTELLSDAYHLFAEPLGWLILILFLAGVVLSYYNREYARPVCIVAWLLFAAFWAILIYPSFVEKESIVRGVGAIIGAPLAALVAKELYNGRDSLFTLSRAVAFTGLIYAPAVMIPALQEQLILLVTDHTSAAMNLIGYDPPVVTELSEVGVDRTISAKDQPYENSFVFFIDGGGTITYSIIVACTGIGSMAVIGGLVLAVHAPPRRKLRALAIAIPIIYVLNIVRNVFIGINYGHQYMHFFPDATMGLFGLDNPLRVSYIWADRILAQSAAVVAMIVIIWLVVRELPEVMEPLEDVLYLLTGNEYDLADAFDIDVSDDTPAEPAD